MKASPPDEYAPCTQRCMWSYDTLLSKPTLMSAPAPPCMEYVRAGTLLTLKFPSNMTNAFIIICLQCTVLEAEKALLAEPCLQLKGCTESNTTQSLRIVSIDRKAG